MTSKKHVILSMSSEQTLASKFARSALTQRQFIKQVDSSVGYFANAQYDVFFLHVILNDSEESHDASEEYMRRT